MKKNIFTLEIFTLQTQFLITLVFAILIGLIGSFNFNFRIFTFGLYLALLNSLKSVKITGSVSGSLFMYNKPISATLYNRF